MGFALSGAVALEQISFVRMRGATESSVYKLHEGVSLFSRESSSGYRLAFLFEASRRVVWFDASLQVLGCLKLLDGQRCLATVADSVGVLREDLASLITVLEEEGVVIEASSSRPSGGRYVRQLNYFAAFEKHGFSKHEYQAALQSARVVVVGAGAIGSWLIESLARAGVGCITVVDPDLVEVTNLPRQAFFTEQDVGKAKVDAIEDRLRQINSAVTVLSVQMFVGCSESLIPHVRSASLVVNCADEPDVDVTNSIVSAAAFQYNVPHILCGGYDGHLSFVGQTVIPFVTSCWECYKQNPSFDNERDGLEFIPVGTTGTQGGTLGPIASITANLHAMEAVKVITDYACPLMAGFKGELDLLTFSLRRIPIARIKDCLLCGRG